MHTLKFFMQVDKLKRELETQNKEKVNWETRVPELEKKIHDLNSKLEDVSFTFGYIFFFQTCFNYISSLLSLELVLFHYLPLIFV